MLTLIARCSQGFIRVGLVQLMHCTYLLNLSKYFKGVETFGLWMKSEASLHTEGSAGDEARGLTFGVSFRVDHWDSKGKVLEYGI